MKLWFSTRAREVFAPTGEDENLVTLSESFYQEIDEHRIPIERHVVAALANAPEVLDFYLWIAWKSWTISGQRVQIPLRGPAGLSQQLGTSNYSRDRRFRGKFTSWLRQIKALWPACPATISYAVATLVVQYSKRLPAIKPAR